MSKKAWEIIAELEKKYAGDEEVLELIENTKEDIRYIEKKESAGGYTGQPSEGCALELKDHLEVWY